MKEVTDGLNNTILLIEAIGRGVHWAEPKDLTFDEAVDVLTTDPDPDGHKSHRIDNGYFYKPHYGRYVAMCDGYVTRLPIPLSRHAAVALLTANGNETLELKSLWRISAPELDYARVWAFSVFVVLALLPAVPGLRPWIWPHGRPQNEDIASS
jgi:hypothetical protein